jgi:AcrR family transcriptional regulator
MADAVLTRDRILDAAEEVLRRYGPTKATVLDVARALDVSHGSVYRHFPSKVALRDAVAERWLARVSGPLGRFAEQGGPADRRLWQWLQELSGTKRRMAREEPELFATFHAIATESRAVVTAHLDTLAGQIARIVADGVARGQLVAKEPDVTGRAVLQATARFHHPAHAAEWADPAIDADLEEVWHLILRGLAAPPSTGNGARKRVRTRPSA